jgi:hypothetical protein
MSQSNINETSQGKESQKDVTKDSKSQNKNESNIEYDDVYVVEERSMPTNELDNADQDDFNEELSLSLSSIDEDTDIFPDSYDALKMESERSKKKLEKKEKEKLTKLLDEKLNFNPKTIKRAEVVEDFIRNFLTNSKLFKTLEEFNQEYSELSKKGRFNDNYLGPITDIYIKNAKLEEKLERMRRELEKANKNADEVKSNWESIRKELNFHKENYLKTIQEKENINSDIKTLEKLHNDFISKISDLNLKYEHLCKNK